MESSSRYPEPPAADVPLPRRHATRLRHYWRTRGWACHDNLDLDLMRWGLIEEVAGDTAASRFLVTAAGRTALGETVVANRRVRSRHAAMVDGVAQYLANVGRLVFSELSVHTDDAGRWAACKPDVFSITRSLRPDHLAPQVHEIKVSRADLLGELRSAKIERYREISSELYFVMPPGLAELDEIPADYGVIHWHADAGYTRARPAPYRDCVLETRHWVALARAHPVRAEAESPQLAF